MALYTTEQRVWVRSENVLRTVSEANYSRLNRKAVYMVKLDGTPSAFMTNSTNLRAADWCCDGCNRWLPGQPHHTEPDGEYPNGLSFCFLCTHNKENN